MVNVGVAIPGQATRSSSMSSVPLWLLSQIPRVPALTNFSDELLCVPRSWSKCFPPQVALSYVLLVNTALESLINMEIVPDNWNSAQEKSLSVPSLLRCCRNLEDNAKSKSDRRLAWLETFQDRAKTVWGPLGWCHMLRICGVGSARAQELAVINKWPLE